jgi:hypothetical protein
MPKISMRSGYVPLFSPLILLKKRISPKQRGTRDPKTLNDYRNNDNVFDDRKERQELDTVWNLWMTTDRLNERPVSTLCHHNIVIPNDITQFGPDL